MHVHASLSFAASHAAAMLVEYRLWNRFTANPKCACATHVSLFYLRLSYCTNVHSIGYKIVLSGTCMAMRSSNYGLRLTCASPRTALTPHAYYRWIRNYDKADKKEAKGVCDGELRAQESFVHQNVVDICAFGECNEQRLGTASGDISDFVVF